MALLDQIQGPNDIKKIAPDELDDLAEEIRRFLVRKVSMTGGHLASNLGAVELTMALHLTLDLPQDKIVWDVGHQSYTHKILTGRKDGFDRLRQYGGISGFPKRSESDTDVFDSGHSSTSISAALGMARARDLLGEKRTIVAVIGDGAMTGGLAYEGLNDASRLNSNLIIILNDNKMSISKNVGAMARYLSSMRMQPWYLRLKSRTERVLMKIPLLGKPIGNILKRSKSRVKHVLYRHTIFEKLGLSYYGPVDGHNIEELTNALNTVRRSKDPALLHVVTVKGKGYKFAEKDASTFHGIGSFNVDTGEPISSKQNFSDIFGEELCRLAEKDKRVCAITAAMRTGTGLVDFSKIYKDRFFDVGIAEEHAITYASGMAVGGMLPVFAVYSSFLQRGYDQIIHDAAMQWAHVVIGVDRAGIVGEDGETHQGVFDVAMLNAIPGVSILSPCYYDGLRASLSTALYDIEGVVAVRYPRGSEGYRPEDYETESVNYDIYGDQNADTLIVTYGRLFCEAVKAAEQLGAAGKNVCILKFCRIKPLDPAAIDFALKFKSVYFFEEGMRSGSISETMRRMLDERSYTGKYRERTVGEKYIHHASIASALSHLGLDAEGMVRMITEDD